jgi:hypothetical protein
MQHGASIRALAHEKLEMPMGLRLGSNNGKQPLFAMRPLIPRFYVAILLYFFKKKRKS